MELALEVILSKRAHSSWLPHVVHYRRVSQRLVAWSFSSNTAIRLSQCAATLYYLLVSCIFVLRVTCFILTLATFSLQTPQATQHFIPLLSIILRRDPAVTVFTPSSLLTARPRNSPPSCGFHLPVICKEEKHETSNITLTFWVNLHCSPFLVVLFAISFIPFYWWFFKIWSEIVCRLNCRHWTTQKYLLVSVLVLLFLWLKVEKRKKILETFSNSD